MNCDTSDASQQFLKTKNGYYYGTTKGKSWWRRYTKDGWLARGNSEIWVDGNGVHFQRYLTKEIKSISLNDIIEITTGKWHAGKWMGTPIIKIAWRKQNLELVSGFAVSWSNDGTSKWIKTLNDVIKGESTCSNP